MSHGLGKIERRILKELKRAQRPLTANEVLAFCLFLKTPATAVAVRRALGSLERKGFMVRVKPDWPTAARVAWELSDVEKRAERARKRRDRKAEADMDSVREEIAALNAETTEKDRLAKLLGMLGSHYDGEVLSAARLVEAERKHIGKTWADILLSVNLS
jgi:predicted Zn-ribbon and HTH transcriptional regulator